MSDFIQEPHEGSIGKSRVKDALLAARRELIDLTRRNRLLNTTRTGSRPHCLEIVEADPNALFVALTREDKHFPFLAGAEISAEETVEDDGGAQATVPTSRLSGLQSKLHPAHLESTSLNLSL